MSAKRQKLEHRNVPLSETFLTQDTPYVPPASLRGGWWWKAEQRAEQGKRAPKEKAPRIVPSSQEHNLRNPFDRLGDDEVSLIIALLPARDTETLRRVSKLWKTKSEYHCRKGALLKHFPWARAIAEGCETDEAANLQFRRCLYYQESLEAGLATRAIRCDGASGLHVHDDRLLWYRADEALSIRDLRTADHRSITESDSMQLDVNHAMPDATCRRYVQIIPGGDFLMTTCVIKDNTKKTHRIRRISARGNVLWSITLKGTMTRPVLGKQSIYFVHGSCLEDGARKCKMFFAKHKICDGSIIFDVSIPPGTRIHKKMLNFDGSLLLTGNERLVSWGRLSRDDVYIFSTSSGQILKKIDQPRSTTFSPLLQSVVPSTHTAGFWTISQCTTILSSYDETSQFFSNGQRYELDEARTYDPPFVTFDGDHSVFLRVLHHGVGRGRTNSFAQLAILPTALASDRESESSVSKVPITLPGRSKADGKRRKLELELPWIFKEGDFFGMMNDYLIYHSRELEFLVLVDFWPVW